MLLMITKQGDSAVPLTKPLNQNVLIEVTREYSSISRSEENENMQSGLLRDYNVSQFHITASAGINLGIEFKRSVEQHLEAMKGKTVRWEQFAEGGQTFEEDGKTYALIPWWRLISVEGEK